MNTFVSWALRIAAWLLAIFFFFLALVAFEYSLLACLLLMIAAAMLVIASIARLLQIVPIGGTTTTVLTYSILSVVLFVIGIAITEIPLTSDTNSSWNTQDVDAFEYGDVQVAFGILKGLSPEDLKAQADTPIPGDIMKRPSSYYGKVIKLTGKVLSVQDYLPASDLSKELAGEAAGMALETSDHTYVWYYQLGSNGNILAGDTVTVYGFMLGQTKAENKTGGETTVLVVVGKLIE